MKVLTVQLQSYILSTTTETLKITKKPRRYWRFNRTSFQQQLKPQIAPST